MCIRDRFQAVYGRQPAILPPLAIEEENPGEEDGISNDRKEARVREIAIQAMVEATSQARINRALKAQTSMPGAQKFQVGDVVEYYKPSSQKDVSGWMGPADIVEVNDSSGQVLIRHRGQEMRRRLQEVRHFYRSCYL